MLTFSLFLGACSEKANSKAKQELTSYKAIRLEEVVEKIQNKENFYLYVGRPTCHYCAKFSPILEEAITHTQVTVYYLNTDNEVLTEAQNFVAKEEIQTVPHLAYYRDGQRQSYLEKGSQANLEEIESFLEQD
ncbi:thioredoxin family protein [Streptococcus minor]|uniref:thioredoxin family protein n=1 Tax=Streptococcus minor TaxID=229549 RepID=UPI000374003A|nr:thioredoxin family protein [Streptococcus minor]